jgi:hypothetical protein
MKILIKFFYCLLFFCIIYFCLYIYKAREYIEIDIRRGKIYSYDKYFIFIFNKNRLISNEVIYIEEMSKKINLLNREAFFSFKLRNKISANKLNTFWCNLIQCGRLWKQSQKINDIKKMEEYENYFKKMWDLMEKNAYIDSVSKN